MIKKLFTIAFVGVLALALIGCQGGSTTTQQTEQASEQSSSSKPAGMDDDVYEKSLALYQTCQDFQNRWVTKDQLREAVNTAYDEIYVGYFEKNNLDYSDVNSGPAVAIHSLKANLAPGSLATRDYIDASIEALGASIGEE